MSALSAGGPDECSVDVPLQTDMTRHYKTSWETENCALPKSEGRRRVDNDFGNNCTEFIKKAFFWRSSTSKHIDPRSNCGKCRSSKRASPKALRKYRSQQKRERGWTENVWRR